MSKRNILLAMFDVRPIGKSVDLILSQIQRELNLRPENKPSPSLDSPKLGLGKPKTAIEKPEMPPDDNYWEELITRLPQRPDFPQKYELTTFSRGVILKELEKTISEPFDVMAELASVGGRIYQQISSKPRTKIFARKKTDNRTSVGVEPELVVDAYLHSPASREIEIWLENLQKGRQSLPSGLPKFSDSRHTVLRQGYVPKSKRAKWSSWFRFNRKAMMWFLGLALPGLLVFGLIRQQSIWARNNIIQN